VRRAFLVSGRGERTRGDVEGYAGGGGQPCNINSRIVSVCYVLEAMLRDMLAAAASPAI
jgi:hypothetical protein